MKAIELEYKKEYRHRGNSSAERACFLGQEGKRYYFVSVCGKDSRICSGKWWMSESQIEKLLVEI